MATSLGRFLVAPLVIIAGAYTTLYARKRLHYRKLRRLQSEIIADYSAQIQLQPRHNDLPTFEQRLAHIPDLLDAQAFAQIRELGRDHSQLERSYIPGHKKGGTVAYEELHLRAPQIVALYQSRQLHTLVSDVVGMQVQPTPLHDQSSCSLLCYTRPGDHIDWHYDHNFYNGRHFTALLPLVNEHNQTGQPSSAQLLVKQNGAEVVVPTVPNGLILFEGAQVLHKVTRLAPEETRIMLSMTFCTDPRTSTLKAAGRRIKDTAFFGVRALWS